MGNCVSASKGQSSALKFDLSVGHNPDGRPHVFNESTIKGTAVGIQRSAAELGTKEEMFFDSQPWLESDCEDYFSVCDDTPSYGNSPIHSKHFREVQFPEKPAAPISATEPPPIELKKQLYELFEESFRANPDEEKLRIFNLPPNSPCGSPYSPAILSEKSPGSMKKAKPSTQSPQCCIPSLVRSLSFGERKKRMKPVNYGSISVVEA